MRQGESSRQPRRRHPHLPLPLRQTRRVLGFLRLRLRGVVLDRRLVFSFTLKKRDYTILSHLPPPLSISSLI